MTNNELDSALALYCGWRKKKGYINEKGLVRGEWVNQYDETYNIPPLYSTSLEEMYEVEQSLSDFQIWEYVKILLAWVETTEKSTPLLGLAGMVKLIKAPARQRAEAMLKMLEKYGPIQVDNQIWRRKTPIPTGDKTITDCEICGKQSNELTEIGIYWVCDNEKCSKKAAVQSENNT